MKATPLLCIGSLLMLGCASTKPAILRQAGRYDEIVEDWRVGEYPVAPKVLRALGLTPVSNQNDIRAALARYGIDVTPAGKASMFRKGSVILVATYAKQHEQIARLLNSLEQGHNIR